MIKQIFHDLLGDLSGVRVGLNASISFDASVQQLLLLMHGCTLYPIPEDVRIDVMLLANAICEWRLDAIDCTPAQLSMLLQANEAIHLPQYLLIGGEAIDQQLWNRLRKRSERFFNVYGPTETTVDTTICDIHLIGELPLLGVPVANAQIYLLNGDLDLVPIGMSGEVYIAGSGL
ncbi:AMP-binding protein, partial [Collimonas pratensis]|uniref:AMP-binding protein n=1 Tax=Collimonas pratensis TaxID=279113 RepID=UPI001F0E02F1